MKPLAWIIILGLFSSLNLFAFDGVEKKTAKLPFHNKIDSAISDQESLHNKMNALYAKEDTAKNQADELSDIENTEKGIVTRFYDYEIHHGGRKEETLVDRRPKSVGPAIEATSEIKQNGSGA